MTSSSIIIQQRFENGDTQQRISIDIPSLMKLEDAFGWFDGRPTPLQSVYKRWEDRRRFGVVQEEDFAMKPIPGIASCKIGVETDNPSNYQFQATNLLCSNELSGRVIAEHPIEAVQADLMYEYLMCKWTGEPAAYQIRHDFGGFRRGYLRLLLPLWNRAGTVTSLACFARHLEAPAGSLPAIQTV